MHHTDGPYITVSEHSLAVCTDGCSAVSACSRDDARMRRGAIKASLGAAASAAPLPSRRRRRRPGAHPRLLLAWACGSWPAVLHTCSLGRLVSTLLQGGSGEASFDGSGAGRAGTTAFSAASPRVGGAAQAEAAPSAPVDAQSAHGFWNLRRLQAQLQSLRLAGVTAYGELGLAVGWRLGE